MKKDLTVVIPNFNGKDLIAGCLDSLQKQKYKDFEVIVVDNGSEDGSVDLITNKFPRVTLIPLEKNTGFAHAVNVGIKKADASYVFLLNNDTELDPDCLLKLITVAKEKKDVGFVTAKFLDFNDRAKIQNATDQIDVVGHLIIKGENRKDSPEFNIAGFTFLASGGGTLIKRQVFEKIGFFDDDFFFYMEDADFFLRAQIGGFKGWYEPEAVVYHIGRATSSKRPKWSEYMVFRNMSMVIIKNFPFGLLVKDFNWLKILLVHLNTIRYLTFRNNIIGVLRAEGFLIKSLPILFKKRSEIQKTKKVNDQYIIDSILERKFRIPGTTIRF
jgi:GT2 family glycosyltransferase